MVSGLNTMHFQPIFLLARNLLIRSDMKNKEDRILLNGEQEAAIELLKSGVNVFLTGEAGTGKSTLVREFIRRCGHECIVLAPTGIAALNAGGTTIHSQMMLKPGLLDPLNLEPLLDGSRCWVLRTAKTIIIDEISMVRGDLFCAMDARLREIASAVSKERPFGGKQIVVVGDFMQLPPVARSEDEIRFVDERLGGKFAFETDLWVASMFRTIFLKTVYRQNEDALFRSILNNLRHGKIETVAKVLNNHCLGKKTFPVPPICLCTTNREAKAINEYAQKKINGVVHSFHAEIHGSFSETDCPTESCLELTVGARVMVLCNQRKDGVIECVNGDIGVVSGFASGDKPIVEVQLDNGKKIQLEPHIWEKSVYSYETEPETGRPVMKQNIIGSFAQIPLRLAYAITIHKSQGLSFNSVYLRLGRGCFDHGQLYTALSRCRTLSGLQIDRPITPEDLIIDGSVVRFCSELDKRQRAEPEDVFWYEEAMQYYLRRLKTGDGGNIPREMTQCEFDFTPRICQHPDLSKLIRLHESGLINKYDAPVLQPIVSNVIDGVGVKDDELALVHRLIAKYEDQ